MQQLMEGAEAAEGKILPAVADAAASGLLPTPAPAHEHRQAYWGGGLTLPKSFWRLFSVLAVTDGMAMHFRCITINLCKRFRSGACSSEQERRSCPHYRRHCEVIVE